MRSKQPAPPSWHDLESQLREEAKRPRPGPSPHLHTRTMAEVSALHRERKARTGTPWWAIPAGVLATIVVMLAILQSGPVRRGGRSQPNGALTSVAGWRNIALQAESVSSDLDTLVRDPFGRELDALGRDAERAADFLAACLPQPQRGVATMAP